MSYHEDTKEQALTDLWGMLSHCRPHSSHSEEAFIQEFVAPLGAIKDDFGNYHLRIGTAPVAWCCHTDSVHSNPGRIKLFWTDDKQTHVRAGDDADCLGADNAAGCWLLREMILAGREGLYLFHRQEEVGCQGSRWIAKSTPEVLNGIDMAIAFDRRGTHSIITHQMPGRTCSDAFGLSLGEGLGLGHQLDNGGTYTDTASYIDLVAECTNVSVGYNNEHSHKENLDIGYILRLREALMGLDLSKVTVARKPGEREHRYASYGQYSRHYGGYLGWENEFDEGCWEYDWSKSRSGKHNDYRGPDKLERYVQDNPAAVASLLEDMGIDHHDLEQYLQSLGLN